MSRALLVTAVISVIVAAVIPLAVGHTPAEWQRLTTAKTRAEVHPVLDRYRQYGMLDDSAQYDVMAINRGWLDLWSQNVIWVEYEGSFEMEKNKVLRLELQRISVFERMASSFLSSDP